MLNNDSLIDMGINAKKASQIMSQISGEQKNFAIENLKKNLKKSIKEIIITNKKDVENAIKINLSSALIDRLTLNEDRINGMIRSLDEIIELENPVGKIISQWTRPNGLDIKKISIPLGVIGMIYESRPNVTIDASAIAIKSGNTLILRGGKDSFYSSHKLKDIITVSFDSAGIPKHSIQMVSSKNRALVEEMITLNKYINVIIPRGGKNLIKTINEKSTVPVIKHLDGICHIFVDKDADLNKAKKIIFNSKMRRPGICGAVETLLIDNSLKYKVMDLIKPLIDSYCEIRGDSFVSKLNKNFFEAKEKDWETEYLEKIISIKIVKDLDEAIDHINKYSSGHTESIITEDNKKFENFYNKIDSAIILQNASTQFADGGEFGFGSEIGISTDKLHVRGPVGAEHLTSFKYVIRGNGQVRP